MKQRLHAALRISTPTVLVAVGALFALIAALPGMAARWQWQRDAVLNDGEWWRVVAGHFCHWDADHLLWDLSVFVMAGLMVARLSRRLFVACVLATAVAVSFMLLVARPELTAYRGLSGIDCALIMAMAVSLYLDRDSNLWRKGLALAVMLAGIAKVLYETGSGSAIFVNATFHVLPSTHIVGLVLGGLFALARSWSGIAARPRPALQADAVAGVRHALVARRRALAVVQGEGASVLVVEDALA